MNVARGGTLHQHLPEAIGTDRHRIGGGVFATNTVSVQGGTALAALIGEGEFGVHSYHPQGVDRVGEGLTVTATDEVGLVQAFESTGDGYVVGVQWHPPPRRTSRIAACSPDSSTRPRRMPPHA